MSNTNPIYITDGTVVWELEDTRKLGGDTFIKLTQAEFDALSEEEQMHGKYCITDAKQGVVNGGTKDYDDLENKPSINNVILFGDKSLSDLGINTITDDERSDWNKNISDISNINTLVQEINQFNIDSERRERKNITSNLTNLTKAVAEQNLTKYGYAIGDYFTGPSGYIYHLADMDTYYGGYNSYSVINKHHIGIFVGSLSTCQWLSSGNATSYAASTLHTFLSGTVLNNIKADLNSLFGNWAEHLLSHQLLNNAVGGWGTPTWVENCYIEALSEVQIYGSRVWSCDSYQTGTGSKKLTIFDKFRFNEILDYKHLWLRSLASASTACHAANGGIATDDPLSSAHEAFGLILFY